MARRFSPEFVQFLEAKHKDLDPFSICKREGIRVVRAAMTANVRSTSIHVARRHKIIIINQSLCPICAVRTLWLEVGRHFFPPPLCEGGDLEARLFAAEMIHRNREALEVVCRYCKGNCCAERPKLPKLVTEAG